MHKELEKVEYLVWSEDGRQIHAAGFVVKDTRSKIHVSLTKSHGEYCDVKIFDKKYLVSREPVSVGKVIKI